MISALVMLRATCEQMNILSKGKNGSSDIALRTSSYKFRDNKVYEAQLEMKTLFGVS